MRFFQITTLQPSTTAAHRKMHLDQIRLLAVLQILSFQRKKLGQLTLVKNVSLPDTNILFLVGQFIGVIKIVALNSSTSAREVLGTAVWC